MRVPMCVRVCGCVCVCANKLGRIGCGLWATRNEHKTNIKHTKHNQNVIKVIMFLLFSFFFVVAF